MERDTTRTPQRVLTSTWPAAWRTGAAAALAGGAVWLLATAGGVDLVVRAGAGTRTVGIVDVLVASGVATLAGWGVRALLRRVTGDGRRAWWVVCAVVGLVSLLGPLAATTTTTASYLVAAHVSVGCAIAVGLARPVRCRPRGRR